MLQNFAFSSISVYSRLELIEETLKLMKVFRGSYFFQKKKKILWRFFDPSFCIDQNSLSILKTIWTFFGWFLFDCLVILRALWEY